MKTFLDTNSKGINFNKNFNLHQPSFLQPIHFLSWFLFSEKNWLSPPSPSTYLMIIYSKIMRLYCCGSLILKEIWSTCNPLFGLCDEKLQWKITEYIIFHILEESLLKLQGNVKYNRQMYRGLCAKNILLSPHSVLKTLKFS